MTEAHDKWLAERRRSIGGSDAAAACCLSRWETRNELWADKALGIERARTPAADHAMMIGHLLEDDVAELYTRETALDLVRGSENGLGIQRNPKALWMHATIDYYIYCHPNCDGTGPRHDTKNGVLQCKTTSARNARYWRKVPPIECQIQLQHELAVTGCVWGSLACLAGTWEFFRYDYDRHERFSILMLALEREFWDSVERLEQPDPMVEEVTRQGLTQTFGAQTTLDGCADVIERVNEELAKGGET